MRDRYKLVIIGDSAVGKTTIASYYTNNACSQEHIPTVGAGYFGADIEIDGELHLFDIWDTAGQELYRSLVPHYARRAVGALIVFDVTYRPSFDNLSNWLDFVANESSDMVKMIFGNKTDLAGERQVTTDEAKQWAEDLGLQYMEGSGLEGTNVNECFSTLAKSCIEERKKTQMSEITSRISLNETQRGWFGCC